MIGTKVEQREAERSAKPERASGWAGADRAVGLTPCIEANLFEPAPIQGELAGRLWRDVAQGAPNDCWEWQKSTTSSGYGQFGIGSQKFSTHRVAYELTKGPIPEGMLVCHRCDNPPCCNPEHLFVGTYRDNAVDMINKRRNHTKLTSVQVQEIRDLYSTGLTQQRIATQFSLSRNMVWNIVSGSAWRIV